MAFRIVAFSCVHPREPRTRILLGLSHRCDPGHEDPLLAENESLAQQIEFQDAR